MRFATRTHALPRPILLYPTRYSDSPVRLSAMPERVYPRTTAGAVPAASRPKSPDRSRLEESRVPADRPDMQRLVDNLFEHAAIVSRLDVVVRAESFDMPDAVREIVALLPPVRYVRRQLCDQLNSAITAHGFGGSMGTVD